MPLPTISSARTARLELPYLFPGQAQKEAFVNEAFARLDALVQPVALDELPLPPSDPAPGACYIVSESASGEWSGHDGALAVWAESQWLYLAPAEGTRVHDAARGSLAVFTSANGWQRAAAPALPAGGATQDVEARAVLAAIVARLHSLGIFSA